MPLFYFFGKLPFLFFPPILFSLSLVRAFLARRNQLCSSGCSPVHCITKADKRHRKIEICFHSRALKEIFIPTGCRLNGTEVFTPVLQPHPFFH